LLLRDFDEEPLNWQQRSEKKSKKKGRHCLPFFFCRRHGYKAPLLPEGHKVGRDFEFPGDLRDRFLAADGFPYLSSSFKIRHTHSKPVRKLGTTIGDSLMDKTHALVFYFY
jgi:hypothetical protein